MPIVASMGGIAGTQTLILATRGIATGKVTNSNLKTLTSKEMAVGLFNGFLWAIVIGFLTFLWFESFQIAWIIGFAVVVNLIFAALSGAVLPSLLTKLNIDPALAGGVILTDYRCYWFCSIFGCSFLGNLNRFRIYTCPL